MAGLGETIGRLARLRLAGAAHGEAASGQAMAEVKGFGPNPGALRMFLHAPADLPAYAPLVVTLHGCGQGAAAFAGAGGWLALAERLGFAVLAPEQGVLNNLNRCFNWFSPRDVARGKGEAASIAAMIGHAVRVLGLDETRIFVVGLSAGGVMAGALLAAYPELFAGGAIIAGAPYAGTRGLSAGLKLMRQGDGRGGRVLADLVLQAAAGRARRPLRLSIWHGAVDEVVNPVNAREITDQWICALGLPPAPVEQVELDRRSRLLWRGPEAGLRAGPAVELNLVTDMGHGAPLSTLRAGDVGAPAPFMLETGVSSTLEIADFWGLAAPAAFGETGGGDEAKGFVARLRRSLAEVLGAIGPSRPSRR
ncbi:MAG: PHB depolymerase family esterase [Caulobacteraceae bacterium]|nr:PHB depolymerase family esterase [Caulobacteraceae bacterium]